MKYLPMAALTLWLCAGCSPSRPRPSDPDEAKAAVQTALDAWKRGEAIDTLRQRTPPIQFADLQWQKGARLLDYNMLSAEPQGLGLRVRVRLSLEGKDGTRRQATTVYTAETQPRIVIVPEF